MEGVKNYFNTEHCELSCKYNSDNKCHMYKLPLSVFINTAFKDNVTNYAPMCGCLPELKEYATHLLLEGKVIDGQIL